MCVLGARFRTANPSRDGESDGQTVLALQLSSLAVGLGRQFMVKYHGKSAR